MSPKQFLMAGGIILLVLGVLGYVLPGGQIFGDAWYLTMGENVAHLVLGVVALGASYFADAKSQKLLVRVVAVVALFFGLYGFVVASNPPLNTFGLANLENPFDNVLHLIVGAWAGYVGWMGKNLAGKA